MTMADWGSARLDPAGGDEDEAALPAFVTDPAGVLRRRWVWMLLCTIVGLGATTGIVLTRKPTYVAQTTILVSSQAIPEEFVRTTVIEDSLSHINAIVGQVLSRQNLGALVEKYSLYPELRDAFSLETIIDQMRGEIEIYPEQSLSQARAGPSSQVFVIEFGHTDPVLAADVANELAGYFTAANIEMRNRQAQLTTDFLRRELNRSERELRDHEHRITAFMEQHKGGVPGELDANLARLERLQAQRQSLATQIDAGESRLVVLKAQAASPDAGPTPRTLLSDLKARLEEQLVILTDEHPNVIALRRRIERLESDVAEEEARPAAPTERSLQIAGEERLLQGLRAQESQLNAAIQELDETVEQAPVRQEEFAALEQRATVLRENYVGFLRKVQEAELAQNLESAQQGARISVLDRAAPPSKQRYARWKLMAAGGVASIGLAIALAVFLEFVDAVVVGRKQLEALTDKPLLGLIPRVA
jgi:uncharacterized protein involved in exopolysaccharide biosynthesis